MIASASELHRAASRRPCPPLALCRLGDRAQPGHAGDPRVRPMPVVQFPDARVRLLPALLDRVGRDRGRAPLLVAEHVVPGRGGQQRQRLAERIQLQLPPDPVAAARRPAGEAAQPHAPLVRDRLARHGVPGHHLRPVGQQPFGDKPDRAGQHRVRPVGGQRQPGVALVPDPGVAVVVVAPGLEPLRQRRGRCRHHGAAGRGQPAQHRVGVPRVGHRDQVAAVGGDLRPGLLGRGPQPVRVGPLIGQAAVADFQNEVVVLARRQPQRHRQPAVGRAAPCPPRSTGTAARRCARSRRPRAVPFPLEVGHLAAAEAGPQVEEGGDPGGPVQCLYPAQQHRPVRVGRHRQRLPALGLPVAHPAAAPDQRPVLVVATPHVPRVGRRDRVTAGTAEQPAERGRAVPARRAQPRDTDPSGPISAPRSPSATSAYSRSTRGVSTSSAVHVFSHGLATSSAAAFLCPLLV